MINKRIDKLYNEFEGFPGTHSIVRNSQRNDAFELYVFETVFNPFHGIDNFERSNEDHCELLKNTIVPPPDNGIDIFFEVDDLDEYSFHIVQVKHSRLLPSEIKTCFREMEATIKDYLKKPSLVHRNLKTIISNTNFNNELKGNCEFYVVHTGTCKAILGQKKNFHIITTDDLEILRKGSYKEAVAYESFCIDKASNFIVNNFVEDPSIPAGTDTNKPKSLLCNFSGYDLAILNNKYSNSRLGRNILYGQNLRETLSAKSKTYDSMIKTIDNEPGLFLYYNNGVTILASSVDAVPDGNKDKIELKNFSIINGAQTTSTLGQYLIDAELEQDESKIENLKKVFVLTKIYEINSKLSSHEQTSERIKIFTNTQTPLSNRDMSSIRLEQRKVQDRFIKDFESPNIFIFIKRGEKLREYPKFLQHQQINNERLAQLCLAGPLQDPFTAKDKRSKIFDNDPQNEDQMLNPIYDKIFNPKIGFLFQCSNKDLDELLFIYKLHEDSKKFHKKRQQELLNDLNQSPAKSDADKNTRQSRIDTVKRTIEIESVFIFHNIAAYYSLRNIFKNEVQDHDNLIFNTNTYYRDKTFKEKLINSFLELIFIKSLEIIRNKSGIGNVQNWTRSKERMNEFMKAVNEEILLKEYNYSQAYVEFCNEFKYYP